MAKPAKKPVEKSAVKPLRVLFIEDVEDDMLLELAELEHAGYSVDYSRVQDAHELKEALHEPWNLIISDYNMPTFSGMDALQIIQEKKLDIPFILVSGVIGEIAAVNLMKSGAHDYIIKDRLARLVPAVQRELREAQIRTEHRESQASLLQSELRLRTLLDSVADAIIVINAQGLIESINPATEKMLGYAAKELVGQNIKKLMPEPYQSHHDEYLQRYAEQGTPHIIGIGREVEAQRKDGSILPVDLSVTEMKIQGQTMYTGIIRDITIRKQIEEALLNSTLQLSEAQAIGHMGNWNWDIQNNTLYWSDEIFRIFDLQPNSFEPSYDAFMEKIHSDDREQVQTVLNKALHEIQAYSIDHRIQLSDGSVKHVHAQADVRFDENGNPLRMLGTIQDISDRKLSEQALRKSEARFRATFEQAAVGVAHVSLDGNWLQVNERLCAIVGYTQEELLKINFQNITHPEDLEKDLSLLNELLAGKRENYSMEIRYYCKDGSITWVQLTVALAHDIKNQPEYFIAVIEDINDRKNAEARLLASLTEKDTVLRELHHRVKNNMQVISSLLSLQARFADPADPQKMLQESRQRIRTMALIHERIYGSDDLAAVDFLEYLRYLGERLTRLYHEPGIDIKIQVSGEHLKIPVDHALPCALISNELITNAIRHAYKPDQHERMIEIRITNSNIGQSQITFRDYGRGIDTKLLEKESNTLGLVIVQALTRQLVGTIEYESLNGTIATLTFPLTQSFN